MPKAAAIARARRSALWPKCSAAVCPTDYRALARELIDAVLPTLADLRSLRAQAYVILAWGHLSDVGGEGHRTAGDRCLVRGAAAGGMLPPFPAAGLAVVRVAHDLCQRGVAARPVHRRPAAGRRRSSSTWRKHRSPSSTARPPPRTSSGRSETAIGIRAEKKRRCTISSPWRPSRWPTPRWPRSTLLGDEEYLAAFRRAHGWFHGQNSLQQPLVDVRCGACCDGLQASGVNRNQGAESTLAYLWTELHNRNSTYSATSREAIASRVSVTSRSSRNPTCIENRRPQSVRGVVPSPRRQPDPHGPGLALSGPHGVQRRRVSVGR